MPTKIILAGEGGQGVQTVAKIIAVTAQRSGKNSSYLPAFGVEQRGGVSLAYLQISSKPITYPRFAKADMVVAFCDRAIPAIKDFLSKDTLFIYDNSVIKNKSLEKIKNLINNYLAMPALALAKEKLSSKVANVVLLGGIIAHLKEIDYQEFEKTLLEEFADKIIKKPEIKDLNLGALKAGIEIAEKFNKEETPFSGIEATEIKTNFSKEKISWQRFPEYCKGCGLCIVRCPTKALQFSRDSGFLGNPMPIVTIEKCIGCGNCMQICPDGAIKVEKST
ncbi:MAG: 2-oxoacid:acceptor oxidoreductase family protein [Patescibacteria group bacterium]|nr:2-oxoacid:acceptor oxidoreductase family protein [Patescibacteria group bacterium]